MKKTTNIHIKGVPFTMEEDAYQLLDDYLKRLKDSLGKQEGADEIVEDIELRIAELLNDISKTETTVIEERHVKDVMATLGDPQEYATDDSEPVQPTDEPTSAANGHINIGRSLFRDKDNGWLGGVCAGIAAYLNINVTLIRLALILFLMIGGSGVLIYVILWMIMPKPKNNLDYLRMRGAPINIESIKEQFAKTSQTFSQNAKDAANEMSEKAHKFGNDLRQNTLLDKAGKRVARLLRLFVGVVLLTMGISMLIGIITFLVSENAIIHNNNTLLTSFSFAEVIFPSATIITAAWFSFFTTFGSITLFLLISAVITILNVNLRHWKQISLGLFALALIGVFTGIYTTVETVKAYQAGVEVNENINGINTAQLVVQIQDPENILSNGRTIKSTSTNSLYQLQGDYLYDRGYVIRYEESKDSLYHITIVRNSQGENATIATNKANNIEYDYELTGDTLKIASYFKFPKKDKIRGQHLGLTIYIPKGKDVIVEDQIVNFNNQELDELEVKKTKSGSIHSDGTYHQH